MAYFELCDYHSVGNASESNVLLNKTFSNELGTGKIGTMIDNTTRTSNGTKPGINQSNSNSPVRDPISYQITTDTNNTKKIILCPPQGYYQGNSNQNIKSYIGISDIGDTNVGSVLSGKTFSSSDGKNLTGTMVKKNNAYPRNNECGYYFDGNYGWVHIPEGLYGSLSNDDSGWAPEIRLTHNDLVNLIDDNVGDSFVDGQFAQYGRDVGSKTFKYDYTAGNSITRYICFIFFAATYSTNMQSRITISVKINNVAQSIVYDIEQSSSSYVQVAHCVCKVNNGDKVYAAITNPIADDDTGLHTVGLWRIRSSTIY